MKRLLRLIVMLCIRHDEEYYKQSAKSKDVDVSKLTHGEICAFKAAMLQLEADYIMEMAFDKHWTKINDIKINEKLLQ